jgi:retron-type reverse transcriptase
MSGKLCIHAYEDIISQENLLAAWKEFVKGKRNKKDVQVFQYCLLDNIKELHIDLKNEIYAHGSYHEFNISDPKPRIIHKASVRDRLLHHAIYRVLYPFFSTLFIEDSYSCQIGKGTHKALEKFKLYADMVSIGNTQTAWILKCDIKKFFASIDQEILLQILKEHIVDIQILSLLKIIIQSFSSSVPGKGLPLGNLTSQLLVNIYMNKFDHCVKDTLKVERYIRYADDFVFMSRDKKYLENTLTEAEKFLGQKLKLKLHPNKVSIKTLYSGVDFLGWVHFPKHKVLRTVTKKRMFKNLKNNPKNNTYQSYMSLIKHGNTYKLQNKMDKNLLFMPEK